MTIQNPSRPFHEVWYLQVNDPQSHRALWLRFALLRSTNGFKRVAETWVVYFDRSATREMKKVALKQVYDMGASAKSEDPTIRIGDCVFSETQTSGSVQSKGNSIQWNFTMTPAWNSSFNPFPKILSKTSLVKNTMNTLGEHILFSGTTTINGEVIHWKQAPGAYGYKNGPRNMKSWTWGHCNSFVTEQGTPVDFIFEGITVKNRLSPFFGFKMSSFFFRYNGKDYSFNTLRDLIYLKSKHSLNEWTFRADRHDISFRGQATSEYKDFVGLVYEDTDGSLLYSTACGLSDLKILVYRGGKLEATLKAENSASFEIASREKNPYVSLFI